MNRLPFWLKISFTLWVLLWIPFYWGYYGPQNFLWFCDIGNIAIVAALWLESRFLFSWQAVSLLLVQILFTIDISGRAIFGVHPIGGSEYMFNATIPLGIRLLSIFHIVTPPLLVWALLRLGYDRRALLVQAMTNMIVLPISWLFGPDNDINWVWGLFDKPQSVFTPLIWLAVCMAGYPLFLYLPSHLVLTAIMPLWQKKRETAHVDSHLQN